VNETSPQAPPSAPTAATPLDRAEAMRLFKEARRLYAVAELVQARRLVGGIDSSVLADRALTLVFELLLRLHGDPVPPSYAELIEVGRGIASSESLLAEDLGPELIVVHEMRERFVHAKAETTAAEDRHYDRALVRTHEWFGAVKSYLDQRLPRPPLDLRHGSLLALAAVTLLGVGFLVGRHAGPQSSLSQSAPAAVGSAPTADPSLHVGRAGTTLPITSPNFSCAGCFPVEKGELGAFVWTTGEPALTVRGLEPDGHYLIALQVVDSGAASKITLVGPDARTDELPLRPGGIPWPNPLVAGPDGTIHWSARVTPFRGKDRIPGATDARLLGIAINSIRIVADDRP
jgi:hypothetical protein